MRLGGGDTESVTLWTPERARRARTELQGARLLPLADEATEAHAWPRGLQSSLVLQLLLARVRVLILKALGETKCQVDNPTATTKLPASTRKPSNQGPSAPPQERLPSSRVVGLPLMGGKLRLREGKTFAESCTASRSRNWTPGSPSAPYHLNPW